MPKVAPAAGRARSRPPRAAVAAAAATRRTPAPRAVTQPPRATAQTPRAAARTARALGPTACASASTAGATAPTARATARTARSAAQTHFSAQPAADALASDAPPPQIACGGTSTINIAPAQLQEIIGGMIQTALASVPGTMAASTPAPTPDVMPQPRSPDEACVSNQLPGSASGNTPQVGLGSSHQVAISSNVRQNIVSHKYVDLGSLLDTADPAQTESDRVFHLVDGRLHQARASRSINSFAAWTTAFLRFAGVYLGTHPSGALGLLTHMQQVSSLNAPGLGFAWREFDEQFRRARELQPELHHWGTTAASSPLWLNAVARGIAGQRAGPSAAKSSAPPNSFRPVCFAFNRAAGCSRPQCRFVHACRGCRGNHSQSHCHRRSQPARGVPTKPNRN